MGGSVPDLDPWRPGGALRAVAGEWASPPLYVAATGRVRWIGMRPMPQGWGLVVAGHRIHTRGMAVPLTLVGLDAGCCVAAVTTVPPGRFVTVPEAVAVMELPAGVPVPEVGEVVAWRPILGG